MERGQLYPARAPSYWSLPKAKEPLVYFIQAECGPIKIGISVTPQARIHMMQAASPSKLRFLVIVRGGKALESEYHERFATHRLHGEWFAPADEIIEEVNKLNRSRRRIRL